MLFGTNLNVCWVLNVSATLFVLWGMGVGIYAQEEVGGLSDEIEQRIRSTVREQGEVVSASHVEVRSAIPGTSTILQVVAEGTQVQAGDLICELDSTVLEQRKEELAIELSVAEGEILEAELIDSGLKKKSRELADLYRLLREKNELELDAVAGEQGEIPTQISALESDMEFFQRKIELLESKIANGDSTGQQGDMGIALLEVQTELRQAAEQRDYLKSRLLPSLMAKLKLEHAEQLLSWTTREVELTAQRLTAKFGLTAARKTADMVRAKIEKVEQQIESSRILAPAAGTVVYPAQVARGGNVDWYPEAGESVRERQTIVLVTDMVRLEVKTLVHESRIARIDKGQHVVVQLDALPDQQVIGRVTRVSQYPEPAGWMQAGSANRYAVMVELVDPPAAARIGMNAVVEIQTDRNDRQEKKEGPAADRSRLQPPAGVGGAPRAGGNFDPDVVIDRVMRQHDTNSDGILDADEIGRVDGRMKEMLPRFDTNQDGSIDRDEMRESMKTMLQRFRRGGGQ